MSTDKPRTEAEILADWRALVDSGAGDRSEGWAERAAQRSERELDLIDEARRLDGGMPFEIAATAAAYAMAYLRRHAQDMRRPL